MRAFSASTFKALSTSANGIDRRIYRSRDIDRFRKVIFQKSVIFSIKNGRKRAVQDRYGQIRQHHRHGRILIDRKPYRVYFYTLIIHYFRAILRYNILIFWFKIAHNCNNQCKLIVAIVCDCSATNCWEFPYFCQKGVKSNFVVDKIILSVKY